MSDTAIHVSGLGKRYRIGRRLPLYQTLHHRARGWLQTAFGQSNGYAAAEDEQSDLIWALKDVSFDVKRGEVLGIIGKNGAGKSTLLKILSRVAQPTSGRAEIYGRVGSLLEVGTGFHPELTGRENTYLNGAILGMRRAEISRKFGEIVDFAGIEKFIDTPVKRHSSGMYVRLAFAVAAHLDPEILIVDEVLAVGGASFQKKSFGKMGDAARQGRTVLLVSHNMASISNLCSRAVLLHSGKIVATGAAGEVVQSYLATTRSTGGEVVWPDSAEAPGNDVVRLHAVRVLQDGIDGPAADVDIAKEVSIQISYWSLREAARLYPAIWLRDGMGTEVLSSSNHKSVSFTEDPWNGRPHPKGLFQAVCRIPGNFLNDGTYSITAIVGAGIADTQILEDYALSFHAHDTGEMRKEYFGKWVGTVRPRLAWHTVRRESVNAAVGSTLAAKVDGPSPERDH